METAYIGLGSNKGDRMENLKRAVASIGNDGWTEVVDLSPVYLTTPVGVSGHPDYYNAVIKIHTHYPVHELLDMLETIERELGRKEKGDLKPREIDIDILLYGREIIKHNRVTVPHTRLKERAFALKPLLDIEPELKCPLTGEDYSSVLKRIHTGQKLEKITGELAL
ncbi:MAG: 2-amino-4-hydroxy-6-hydroxymethyldihydropteridine diphosphokinase [candidate division Zixibacteria bacterium]|nr:2-amino-4-hydroxy-6-hydroxymethyldihydropteridine diphosphokinase [candidate division Zixibacteria bacterium]